MTGPEANQIMGAIKELKAEIYKQRQLIVGNGNPNAVLPRLQNSETRLTALEKETSETRKVQPFIRALIAGSKALQPIVNAILIAGLLYLIFGSP